MGQGPETFFGTHGNKLPSLSGVHGFKEFLCSAHLVGSFDGRIYIYGGSVLKSKFVHQRIQQDRHFSEKILDTMNSREGGELITVGTKKCLGALSHPITD